MNFQITLELVEPRVGFEPTMFLFLITSEVESTAVPPWLILVGLVGNDPTASTLSVWRSNHLSYSPLYYYS